MSLHLVAPFGLQEMQKLPSFVTLQCRPCHVEAWIFKSGRLINGLLRLPFGNFWRGEKIEAKEKKAREQGGEAQHFSINPSFPFFLSMFSFALWVVNPFSMF